MKRQPEVVFTPTSSGGGRATAEPVTRTEITEDIRRAGLVLNPGQQADLALAWGHFTEWVASIPRARPLVDDFAHRFLLPPPAAPQKARKTS